MAVPCLLVWFWGPAGDQSGARQQKNVFSGRLSFIAYEQDPLARFRDLDGLVPVEVCERLDGNVDLCASDQQGHPSLRPDERVSCWEHGLEMLDRSKCHNFRFNSRTLSSAGMDPDILKSQTANDLAKERRFLLL